MELSKILTIILGILVLFSFVVPFVSAYDSTTDPSSMPAVIAVFGVLLLLIILALACGEKHPILSVSFAFIALFLMNNFLQISLTYLTGIASINDNINFVQEILTYVCYGVGIYMLVYITINILSGLGQKKQERMEGLL